MVGRKAVNIARKSTSESLLFLLPIGWNHSCNHAQCKNEDG